MTTMTITGSLTGVGFVAALSYIGAGSTITINSLTTSGKITGTEKIASLVGHSEGIVTLKFSDINASNEVDSKFSLVAGAFIAFAEATVSYQWSSVVSKLSGSSFACPTNSLSGSRPSTGFTCPRKIATVTSSIFTKAETPVFTSDFRKQYMYYYFANGYDLNFTTIDFKSTDPVANVSFEKNYGEFLYEYSYFDDVILTGKRVISSYANTRGASFTPFTKTTGATFIACIN